MVTDVPEARLRVHNRGGELLELSLEPYGEDYWLRPGETFVVTTTGVSGPEPWIGTTYPHEPFEVDYYGANWLVVHFNGDQGWVTDHSGERLCCAHQRPDGWAPGA